MESTSKESIVISAVNLIEGGGYTVLVDCLKSLSDSNFSFQYTIYALVHDITLMPKLDRIEYMEFPKAKKRYLYRFYYEYFYFHRLSRKLKPRLWLSLHDMSPRVDADIQAVYMHNPTPFYHPSRLDWKFVPINAIWAFIYKYVYRINIHANKYLVVQQQWLREEISRKFSFPIEKIIVARPEEKRQSQYKKGSKEKNYFVFFYPSYPRVFKNFEVICEAVKLLEREGFSGVKVKMTIDGSENKYSQYIISKYKELKSIDFIGLQSKADMDSLYSNSDCLIFPSKLETWGLPISEFKSYNRPMIIADFPYAHETAEGAGCVSFFDSNNSKDLADVMKAIVQGDSSSFNPVPRVTINEPHSSSWNETFDILLNIK